MVLPIALSAAFLLSSTIASVTYLKFLRRFTPPSCCGNRLSLTDGDGEAPAPIAYGPDSPAGLTSSPILFRRFRWAEIELFTNSFTSDVIGEGGFSTVYLARLPDSSLAAVKLHRSGNSERLLRAFKQELDVLFRLSNPHIVRLIGYSDHGEDGASALVFEYIPGGTLRDRLVGCEAPLPWDRRLSIALHVAEAVDYLHEGGELPIVHGDITAANVLLDERRGPKLCDFGSARVGFSAAVKPAGTGDPIIGSPGYTDPYYLRTGIFSKKSDVYSFGVMLLELITGLPAIAAEEGGSPLAAAALRGAAAVAVDPMVAGSFDEEEGAAALGLAALCVGDQPSLRPSMAQVIRFMRESLPSSISTVYLKSDGSAEP
ncbi:hypothetical protein IEQ34_008059 [Dendrobium chrysotoxum]|uniref:Protein kinase domain-containing protein n=1 Tax=Dendrobium chrysotoxum TaxID=161865 RepID=A0AAV7H548_DENCH|nr:hypothetical protein IEQ34_008059 [Dendrobium chrysotoxum]